MNKKVILFFGAMLLVIGCAGLADYNIDLPGNYSIIRTSGHEITIAPKTDIGWGPAVVPTEIIKASWNKNYVIAKQKDLEDNELYFWIIDTKTGNKEKFLNKNEFKNKLKKYNINVKMKDVDSLR